MKHNIQRFARQAGNLDRRYIQLILLLLTLLLFVLTGGAPETGGGGTGV
jgi:hypothetical protein